MQLIAPTPIYGDQNPLAEMRQVISRAQRIEDYQAQKLKQLWEAGTVCPSLCRARPVLLRSLLRPPDHSEGKAQAASVRF